MATEKNKTVQKWLKRLISEEMIAHDMYVGCVMTCKKDQVQMIRDLFLEIAVDERDEHARDMIDWALANGYDVPFKYKDYEKCASEATVKQFNALKADQDSVYYVDQALKAEQDAILSYEEALDEELPLDLVPILTRNYYDEVQHLEQLGTMKIACEAGMDLVSFG